MLPVQDTGDLQLYFVTQECHLAAVTQVHARKAPCYMTCGSPMDAENALEAGTGNLTSRSNVRDMPIPEGHEFRGVQGICSSPMVRCIYAYPPVRIELGRAGKSCFHYPLWRRIGQERVLAQVLLDMLT